MQFHIDPKVLEAHPDLTIGVIAATNIQNATGTALEPMLREAEQHVCNTLNVETFKEHPHLAALQEVHRSFGNNPNKYPPSAQALVKRVLKGGQLPSINPLVDLYNIISLKHVVCVGAEDTDACVGDIHLTYADGTESFVPLGSEENEPPAEGELVYKDDEGVICRKLNWREGKRTMTTDDTTNAVIVVEGFAPMERS